MKPTNTLSTPAPQGVVEHFFRHEAASLVAVLTRAFGIARADLIEDVVQSAMMEAMTAWRRGIPDNPAAWIHRVAKNRALDALRREKVHRQSLSLAGQSEQSTEALLNQWLSSEQLPDSLLRMMFVCCHPALDRRSQIAMTLKTLCGFSVAEIASGLLMKEEAVKKRISRAKKTLANLKIPIELPEAVELSVRLESVQEVLYLMFNEGYSTSHGIEPIRDDVCEEAARLCHLLSEHPQFGTSSTLALLALMLFHAARLDSRIDQDGAIVLLEDQDRTQWDQDLIAVGQNLLARSMLHSFHDDNVDSISDPSRYHLEAAIAQIHCRAASIDDTDWARIVSCYDRLSSLYASPIYELNRAIARGQSGDTDAAIAELQHLRQSIRGSRLTPLSDYHLLDCAIGRMQEMGGDYAAAAESYRRAMTHDLAPHERVLLERTLGRLESNR